MPHDKDYSPSASELMVARDAALEALAWSTPTGCDVRGTSLGGGVICYYCGTDCECMVCRTQEAQLDGTPDNDGPLTMYHDDPTEPDYRLPEMMDGLPFYWGDESKAAMLTELTAFITDETNSDDLHGLEYEQIGHDFILTRNGHGTGFWDRGLGERGDRLTAACKPYGEAYMHANFEAKTYKLGA